MCQFFLYFFFFQAEDGIRDYKVTGVQPCALPIYEGDRDGAIVHRLHVLLLEIQRHRPEDDVHCLQDFEQIFRQVEHRLLAAAAGGTPVEGNFWLHATSDRRARSSPVLHSGPSAFNCATISLTTTRTRSPSAAEIHSRRNRSSSMPICLRSLLSNRYRRSAL